MTNRKIREIRETAFSRGNTFKDKVLQACSQYAFESAQLDIIKALLGISSKSEALPASSVPARVKLGRALERAMRQHRRAREKSSRNYYFGTLLDDSGNTSDRAPVLSIKGLKDKGYRAIKSIGLNAVAVIEVHPLMNYPAGGEGRTLMWHIHFLGWTDMKLDVAAAVSALEKTGAWSCKLGAPPISIKEVRDTREDIAEVTHYMAKAPHAAKNRRERKDKPGSYKLLNTLKGYRPELALRVFEGLSQIGLLDTVFGVGDGGVIRQSLRKELTDWHRKRPVPIAITSDFDVWMFWIKLRQTKGSKHYLPFRIMGNSIIRAAKPKKPKAAPAGRRKGSVPSKAQKRAFYNRVQRLRGKRR